MKLRLLIAVADLDYSSHLSNVLTKSYSDDFEVAMCSSSASLEDLLRERVFDIALFSSDLAAAWTTGRVKLPVILCGDETTPADGENTAPMVRKYQRISSLISTVLELYAKEVGDDRGISSSMGHVTVVWSPYGGCGKTTVALAYATCQCLKGKRATYLDLEPFSSTEYYFGEDARSISTVFENLETNVELMLKSIEKQDESSGVFYYGGPNNYDDINVLSVEDLILLVTGCTKCTQELVIDTAGTYDDKIRALLEAADNVLLVTDGSQIGQRKLQQFYEQHDLFKNIKDKLTIVSNRNAPVSKLPVKGTVVLPVLNASKPNQIFKALSAGYFESIE